MDDYELETDREYWLPTVKSAESGDAQATRMLFAELVRFLEGPPIQNAVLYSPEARAFLAARMKVAFNESPQDMGAALNIGARGAGKRRSKHHELRGRFLDWYHHRLQETGQDVIEGRLPPDEVEAWLAENDVTEIAENTLNGWIREARSTWKAREWFQ